ncbi:unnamed protein product, partial [Didymodactylos carnosus]
LLQDNQTRFTTVEQSPYEEVAAYVSNTDDSSLPCSTFRSWTIGILFVFTISMVNQLFYFRSNGLSIGVVIAQVLSKPIEKLMARFLPKRTFHIWQKRKWSFTLNPGPFNIEEHTVITVMAHSAAIGVFAASIVVMFELKYRKTMNFVTAIAFLLTTQMLGFGMAGIMRRFVVWPNGMIWPGILVLCSFFRALHETKKEDLENNLTRWKMSRFKMFCIVFGCSFCYYWFPGYIFPLLSAFSFICIMKPRSVIFSQTTGITGFSLVPFSRIGIL